MPLFGACCELGWRQAGMICSNSNHDATERLEIGHDCVPEMPRGSGLTGAYAARFLNVNFQKARRKLASGRIEHSRFTAGCLPFEALPRKASIDRAA